MIKFIGKVVGSRVITFQERVSLGVVTKALIDPVDKTFIGLGVRGNFGMAEKYISLIDIKGFAQNLVIVEDINSLTEADEVVRFQRVLENEPQIIGATVVSEAGDKLGRVEDATINLKLAVLDKIYVVSSHLPTILSGTKIIHSNQIVKIEPKRIIVRDATAKVEQSELISAEALPAE